MKIQTPGSSHTATNAAHVALFVAPGKDYHWYRQDADGSWSQKVAEQPVRNTDASNQRIWNPLDANNNYSNTYELPGENYSTFVGFYAVQPLDLALE